MSTKELNVLLKVIVAVSLGGIFGIERVIAKKPIGICKKNMFVAGAVTLVMLLYYLVINEFNKTFRQINRLI
jgi:uncharacterized membrane protein YhiD involved in acid resistance